MSTGSRYLATDAYAAYSLLGANLTGCYVQLELAGSLRRLLSRYGTIERVPPGETVGDVELVVEPVCEAEPAPHDPLFSTRERNLLWERVNAICYPWPYPKAWGEKLRRLAAPLPGHTAFNADGVKCELYAATPDNFGYILTLRTGPAGWNHLLVTPRHFGGLRPAHVRLETGKVSVRGKETPVPTEAAFFQVLGLPFVEPHLRSGEMARRLREEAA